MAEPARFFWKKKFEYKMCQMRVFTTNMQGGGAAKSAMSNLPKYEQLYVEMALYGRFHV